MDVNQLTYRPPEVAAIAEAASAADDIAPGGLNLSGLGAALSGGPGGEVTSSGLPNFAAMSSETAPPKEAKKSTKKAAEKPPATVATEDSVEEALNQFAAANDIPTLELGQTPAVVPASQKTAPPPANGTPATGGGYSAGRIQEALEPVRKEVEALAGEVKNLKVEVAALSKFLKAGENLKSVTQTIGLVNTRLDGHDNALAQVLALVTKTAATVERISVGAPPPAAAPAGPAFGDLGPALKEHILLVLPDMPANVDDLAESTCKFLAKQGHKLWFEPQHVSAFLRESGAADEDGDVSKQIYLDALKIKDPALAEDYVRRLKERIER